MHVTKYLAPAFAVLGFAAAQSSICSSTATITNQAQATQLAQSCTTVKAIIIDSTASGPISLDGIKKIENDLTALDNKALTGISGGDLQSIGGDFKLTSLTILSNLGFPKLTSVKSLTWITLPQLQQLGFTTGISQASTLFITDTQLNNLDGINLETVGNMEITNNRFLKRISTQVTSISQALTINNNGNGLVLEFPNLLYAYNITVRNTTSLSIPSLQHVNSTFGVYGSYMESVMAPNLTVVEGDLAFVADSSLTNVSFPLLTKVGGGLLIANNTKLIKVNGFPLLSDTGAINMSGNFTDAELPSISIVRGTFNAQSSGNFSCDPFQSLKNSNTIRGSYFCSSSSNNVQDTLTGSGTVTGTGTGTGTSASASPTGAASLNGVSSAVGAAALLGGLLQFLI